MAIGSRSLPRLEFPALLAAACLPLWLLSASAEAGVATDGTVGPLRTLSGPTFAITEDLGRREGGNLFHSFHEFSIATGQSATFSGAADVQNVIARVTGGSASSIEGMLRSQIQDANLFLINPHGVLFGPGASLDISGSFLATTADYVALGADGRFHASNPAEDVLSSAPPAAFGFLTSTPKPVSVQRGGLILSNAGNVALLGGDVNLNDGAIVAAQNGVVHLAGVRSPGELALDIRDRQAVPATDGFAALADISVTRNSSINVGTQTTGGRLVIRGGNLVLSQSFASTRALDRTRGEGVDIQLRNSLALSFKSFLTVTTFGDLADSKILQLRVPSLLFFADGQISLLNSSPVGKGGRAEIEVATLSMSSGQIDTSAFGAAEGGEIDFHATGDVSLLGDAAFFSFNGGIGKGGAMRLNVGGKLELALDSKIASDVQGRGPGGDLDITAGSVLIRGDPALPAGVGAGIVTNGEEFSIGRAGDLRLTVSGALELRGGGNIQVAQSGTGDGGHATISAQSLVLAGSKTNIGTALGDNATGRGGDLEVTVRESIEIRDGAAILAETKGNGTGGNLSISAESLALSGGAQIGANSTGSTKTGNAGNLDVDILGALTLTGGSALARTTLGPGSGGDLRISAGSLLVSGTHPLTGAPSGIGAETTGLLGGAGGNLFLTIAGPAKIADGGLISVTTLGAGRGGDLSLTAASLEVSGAGAGITGQTLGRAPFAGAGGNVTLNVGGAVSVLDGGNITTNSLGDGDGGTITLTAGELTVSAGGTGRQTTVAADTSRAGAGGDVRLQVAGSVRIEQRGRVSAATQGAGSGGTIEITAGDLFLDGTGSGISVQTTGLSAGGPGGNLLMSITRDLRITGGGIVSAGSRGTGRGGDLVVNAGTITISGADSGIGAEALALTNAGDGGTITIMANELTITGEADAQVGVSTSTLGPGAAGAIDLRLGRLVVTGGGRVESSTEGTGDGGPITIAATGLVSLTDGGRITTQTTGLGNAGGISVRADALVIDGTGSARNTGLVADSGFFENRDPLGNTGSIDVQAKSISITGSSLEELLDPSLVLGIAARSLGLSSGVVPLPSVGSVTIATDSLSMTAGLISAETLGSAQAGSVTISASDRVTMSGGKISSATADRYRSGSATLGRAGAIRIDAGIFEIADGGEVITLTDHAGAAGNIEINANRGASFRSGGSLVAGTDGAGAGGNVRITTPSLEIGGGFEVLTPLVSTNTKGAGPAGRIEIFAGTVAVGGGSINTTTVAGGRGGDIFLQATDVAITDFGIINASASAPAGGPAGDAGNIRLELAGSLLLDGFSSIAAVTDGGGRGGRVDVTGDARITLGLVSAISTETSASGAAGDIHVFGRSLELRDSGSISSRTTGSGDAGAIALTFAEDVQVGTFSRISAATETSLVDPIPIHGNAGSVSITADTIVLSENSRVSTSTDNEGRAGDLSLIARGSIDISSFASVSASTEGAGQAGGISLQAPFVFVTDSGRVESRTFDVGNAGKITIDAASALEIGTEGFLAATTSVAGAGGSITLRAPEVLLYAGGFMDSSTGGAGNAGAITIETSELSLESDDARMNGGIFNTTSSILDDAGAGGTVHIVADRIRGDGAVSINAATFGAGPGGSVVIDARESVIFDGHVRVREDRPDPFNDFFGIFATSRGEGKAGSITLWTPHLKLRHEAVISTSSEASGDAGPIDIRADRIALDGAGAATFTGIFAVSRTEGKGGDITVRARDLQAVRGSGISTSTFGSGDAGDIHITAARAHFGEARPFLLPDFTVADFAGVAATAQRSAGNGGDIHLQIGELAMDRRATIAANTTGAGNGGSIRIVSRGLSVASGATITAATSASGASGDIFIHAGDLLLRDRLSTITSSAEGVGNAGSVDLDIAGAVTLRDGSSIASTSLRSSAGRVDLRADGAVVLDQSALTVQARAGNAGEITLETPRGVTLRGSGIVAEAGGSGGNITISAAGLTLDSSRITANAVAGDGGLITLNLPATGVLGDASDFIVVSDVVRQSADSRITASSQQGVQGALAISAPELDLSNSVEALSAALIDAASQLREQCARRLDADFSSFLILGRGGMAETPEDAQASGAVRQVREEAE